MRGFGGPPADLRGREPREVIAGDLATENRPTPDRIQIPDLDVPALLKPMGGQRDVDLRQGARHAGDPSAVSASA
mgnify:CR=1 FL=1